jgi:hypothetical protein
MEENSNFIEFAAATQGDDKFTELTTEEIQRWSDSAFQA